MKSSFEVERRPVIRARGTKAEDGPSENDLINKLFGHEDEVEDEDEASIGSDDSCPPELNDPRDREVQIQKQLSCVSMDDLLMKPTTIDYRQLNGHL